MIRLSSVVLFLFVAVIASAQEPFRVSSVVSFDFGSPLFFNRTAGVLNPFGISPNGNSSSESYGIGADAVLPDLLGHLSLLGRLEEIYNTGSFTFTSQPYSISGHDLQILFELGALVNSEPLSFRFGPWISYSLSRTISEVDPTGVNITPANAGSNIMHIGISGGVAWHIPKISIIPELHSHFDLTEAGAGINAASMGLSLTYVFGSNAEAPPTPRASAETSASSVSHRRHVQLFANGSELHGPVPLERQELHITEYALDDSNGTIDTHESQWIEESFHLPDISVRCGAMGSLKLSNGSGLFAEVPTGASDTTIHLGDLAEWNRELERMNIDSTNRIVVTFESVSGKSVIALWRDTLLLPPADTNGRPVVTTTKKECQFRIPDRMERTAEGRLAVDSILHAARELPARTVSIHHNPSDLSSDRVALLERIDNVLGPSAMNILDTSISDAILVVIQE